MPPKHINKNYEENVKLVELVKEYKCIYDKNDHDYRNFKHKRVIWDSIAKDLNTNVYYAKQRWKNLFLSFTREMKSRAMLERKSSVWYFTHHMMFLKDFVNIDTNVGPSQPQVICVYPQQILVPWDFEENELQIKTRQLFVDNAYNILNENFNEQQNSTTN